MRRSHGFGLGRRGCRGTAAAWLRRRDARVPWSGEERASLDTGERNLDRTGKLGGVGGERELRGAGFLRLRQIQLQPAPLHSFDSVELLRSALLRPLPERSCGAE